MVSLTQARANALIGVFISVTTIPAAASIGVSIAFSSWGEARGSALLLLNVVVLIAVGAAGLTAQRRIWHRHATRPPRRQWLPPSGAPIRHGSALSACISCSGPRAAHGPALGPVPGSGTDGTCRSAGATADRGPA
jgi:Domain of unknown function (DUF389)